MVNADGTGARKLTPTVPGRFATSPTWSPDGRYLAFDIQLIPDLLSTIPESSNLYAVRADGANLTQLTNDGRSLQPAWGRLPGRAGGGGGSVRDVGPTGSHGNGAG